MKTAAVLSFSDRGADTAQRVARALEGEYAVTCHAPKSNLKTLTAELFHSVDALIFVGAMGIAVRAIAPLVVSKTSDPAVLVLDERAEHVISVLSGHIGGANELTWALAGALESEAVITTATDVNHRFSVDAWAARQGLKIESMPLAKRYAAEILKRDLPFLADVPVEGAYPAGTFPGDTGALGAAVTCRDIKPFDKTLRLIPPVLMLGIGCKRDTPAERIRKAVEDAFARNDLLLSAAAGVASIDVKSDEAGLLAFAEELGITPVFYSAEELRAVEGEFTASAFVAGTVGVDNVCERAAVLSAGEGGELLVRKTSQNGVTVAVARKIRRITFE